MSLFRELSYQANITPVRAVQFALLSPEEILKRSVVHVTSTESFNGSVQVPNGLFDQRMGVVEHGKFCQTCQQGYTFCPGHIGHIELATPVFHVHFFNTVIKVLKCVCWRCSKLLLHPDSPELTALRRFQRQKRWEAVYNLITKTGSVKRCSREDGCGALQPSRTTKHEEKFLKCEISWDAVEGDMPSKITLGAEDILRVLQRITDADVVAMGFHPTYSRPEWMIATVLPVPPPAVRPSAKNDMGQRSEDDLTTVLCNIVKTNNTLLAKKRPGKVIDPNDQQLQLLQYYVATMVDNTIPNMSPATQRTGRSIKSISERLKGKEGRVRGNLLGKRVDYSARSVITPDPNISVNELGVPLRVAMNLTFPETVTPRNRATLVEAVQNGPNVYPGARFIQKASEDMRTVQLRAGRAPPELSNGDVVHRHMRDGDYVLFNRQPSLHKMSMMAHRVRVMEHNTFRLNASVTPAYNADFDGDEMNLHLPISPFSMTEIALLAGVPMHVLSPKNSGPIMAIVQDVALGVHVITLPEVRINAKNMYNLMACVPRFDGHVPRPISSDSRLWSGRQALSTVIPASVNGALSAAGGTKVHVRHGQLSEEGGALVKGAYQTNTKGLVHSVYNELGPRALTDMMDGTQRIVCDWLLQAGFSVGLSDLSVDESVLQETNHNLIEAEMKVTEMIAKIHGKGWRPKAGLSTPAEQFENDVNTQLNAAREAAEKTVMSRIDPSNRILRMITAGSKGGATNLVQMTATLGQQNVDQKRPGYGFDGRTLPHYAKYDDGPEARGFVRSSFAKGLNPSEFLFHSMGGRVGLIDTAVRTSESGYISRKLVKAMEDCKVANDGTVRNALGQVVQVLYGEDGMDTTSIEKQEMFNLEYDGEKMSDEFLIVEGDPVVEAWLAPEVRAQWEGNPQWQRFKDHFYRVMEDRCNIVMYMSGGKMEVSKERTVHFPVNLARMLTNAVEVQRLTVPRGWPSDLDPRAVLDELDVMEKELVPAAFAKQSMVFGALLRSYLSPKRLLSMGMTRSTFDRLVSDIRDRFEDSLSQPGDMVGIVTAQSLGEPTTQLTLNTFHLAGVSSVSKAVSGLPRVMELLNVTANPKKSLIYVHLPEDMRFNAEAATKMKSRIETTRLASIVTRSQIFYDPDDTRVEEDRELVDAYRAFVADGEARAKANPWVIRIEFDRAQMLEHDVTMLDVSESLSRFYRDTIESMHSDDNSAKLVFRIRLSPQGNGDLLTEVRAFESAMMESVTLKGSIGITTAIPMQPPSVKEHEFDGATGKFVPISDHKEWVLETDGRDLSEVLASPLVDSRRTHSNDICETLRVLGVEAARRKLYEELQDVLRDSGTNPRHFMLLVDTMTLGGGLQSINRHGINRGDIGPLAKCSFEETTDMLTCAAMFADVDKVNGVSASIMLGQVPPGGTGSVQPLLDESLLTEDVFVEHPHLADEDAGGRRADREEMCRRIMRFAPVDLTIDDGWNKAIAPMVTVV